MAFFKGKFESCKQEWVTPDSLFDKLNNEFHFTIDLAADIHNSKCKYFYSEKNDALQHEWVGMVGWLNPPYGAKKNKLSDWVKKAYQETKKYSSTTVVMLIPARTNTRWWHQYAMHAAEIRFINGRPKFGDATHGLPQPLAIVVFKLHPGTTKLGSFEL
jgi:site-specific DNA-methyltransferase (adenine-specific)